MSAWAEAKWTVDNIIQKIGQPPANMRVFAAAPKSKTSIALTFLEPEDMYVDGNLFVSTGGVMIRMGEDDYPTATGQGVLVVDNKSLGKYETEPFIVDGLIEGKTYYFAAFPYSARGVYNTSPNSVNHASAEPLADEKVIVNVDIDDASEFESATVTCVDETDASKTQTATVTPDEPQAVLAATIGHTYHVEYGDAQNYIKPENTESKVSVAGTTTEYTGKYEYFTATINVTYPAGATVTCESDDTSYTADSKTGTYTFKVHRAGVWTITATSDSDSESTTVEITEHGQSEDVELSFVRIYGIKRDITSESPEWERTDDAVGKTATGSIGTVAGSSDFDKCYPWSDIARETLSTGDVMVKIPKFYYQREINGNYETIKIADKPTSGFAIHPAFSHNGTEQEYIYVGAYKTSSNNKSATGASPTASQTRATMRTNATSKGTGWGLIDISTVSAIQMLFLVEFATNNSQSAIGDGYTNGSAAIKTGTCNSVPNLTGRPSGTSNAVDVVYRGIEGFWGNVREFVDGINFNSTTVYVCNTQSNYADDTSSNYTKLSYAVPSTSSVYIKTHGIDTSNSAYMLPNATGGSSSTYFPDYWYYQSGWRVFSRGGYWGDGSYAGLFFAGANASSSSTGTYLGSRLLFLP